MPRTSSITSLTIAPTPKQYAKERRWSLFESFLRSGSGKPENAPSEIVECNSRVPNLTVGIGERIDSDEMFQWSKDTQKTLSWNDEDVADIVNKICCLFFWWFLLMVVWIKSDGFDGPAFEIANDGWVHRFAMLPECINPHPIPLPLAARVLFRSAWLGFPQESKKTAVTVASLTH
jgi:hypothetical protein